MNGDFLWTADLGRLNVGAPGFPLIEWGPASSPIIWNDPRHPVRGYDPRTGRERWRLRSGTMGSIPTPVADDGLVVVASSNLGPHRPIVVVRPGAAGDLTPESETAKQQHHAARDS